MQTVPLAHFGDEFHRADAVVLMHGENEVRMHRGLVGIEAQRLAVGGDGGVLIALARKGQGEHSVGASGVGIDFDRFSAGGDGFVDFADAPEGVGEIAEAADVIGIEAKLGAGGFGSPAVSAEVEPDAGEIAVEIGDFWVDFDGMLDESNGAVEFAALACNDAEEMKGVGVVGKLFEDLAIDRLGGGEVALVMEGDGLAEELVEPCT